MHIYVLTEQARKNVVKTLWNIRFLHAPLEQRLSQVCCTRRHVTLDRLLELLQYHCMLSRSSSKTEMYITSRSLGSRMLKSVS